MQALAPRSPRCSRSSQRTQCQRALCSRCPCQSLNPEVEGDNDDIDDLGGVEEALIECNAFVNVVHLTNCCPVAVSVGKSWNTFVIENAFEVSGGETLDWEPEDIHTDPSFSNTFSQFEKYNVSSINKYF